MPLPSGVQLTPSHFAMLLAGMPPAIVNRPPAKRAGPGAGRTEPQTLGGDVPAPGEDQGPLAHVGASGLVFGYFGYLLMRGLRERSLAAIGLALLTLMLYGGLIWGVFPSFIRRYSWEGHLFGLIAGGLAGAIMAAPASPTNRQNTAPR